MNRLGIFISFIIFSFLFSTFHATEINAKEPKGLSEIKQNLIEKYGNPSKDYEGEISSQYQQQSNEKSPANNNSINNNSNYSNYDLNSRNQNLNDKNQISTFLEKSNQPPVDDKSSIWDKLRSGKITNNPTDPNANPSSSYRNIYK